MRPPTRQLSNIIFVRFVGSVGSNGAARRTAKPRRTWLRSLSRKSTPQQQANEREAATAPVVTQAPPPPGMGKLVDKTA